MLDRSLTKQWLVDSRGDMKLLELVRLLNEAGYRTRNGEPVKEPTIRGWEAPSGGDIPRKAIPYLERIFKSKAPGWIAQPADQSAVVLAIDRQTLAIKAQTEQLERLTLAVQGIQVAVPQAAGEVEGRILRELIAALDPEGTQSAKLLQRLLGPAPGTQRPTSGAAK